MSRVLGLSNGRGIDPYNFYPPRDFDPRVVAKSLSNLCRYAGHYGWMSVAEHCLIVANIMKYEWNSYAFPRGAYETESGWRLVGLLHDSTESVFGDITTPVKRHSNLDFLREKENAYLYGIYVMHGVYPNRDIMEKLHKADKYAMSVEIEHLGYYASPLWEEHVKNYPREDYPDVVALGMQPSNAEEIWFELYEELTEKNNAYLR